MRPPTPLEAKALGEIADLADDTARRSYLATHPDLARPDGVRSLQAAAREFGASDPRWSLRVAELATLAAAHLDSASRLVALRARAQAVHALNRFRESAELHAAIAGAHERLGEWKSAASARLARVEALMFVGRASAALAESDAARALYRRAGSRDGIARVDVNEGIVRHRLDDFRDALACFRRARPTFARRGDRATVAVIDLNRAATHSMLGRAADAARLFAAARAGFVALGRTLQVTTVDYNVAYDHYLNGRYDPAFRAMEAAHDAFAALGHPVGVALTSLDLAEMSLELGAPRPALGHAQLAQQAFERLGISLEAARAQCFAAVAHARLGDVAGARTALAAAVVDFADDGHEVRAALARLEFHALEVDAPATDAGDRLAEVRSILERAGHQNASVRALFTEGMVRRASDPARARRLLRTAASRAARQAIPDIPWRVDAALARLDLLAGRPAAARRRLDNAVTAVDRLRADVRRADLSGWLLSDRNHVYDAAMRAWIATPKGGAERAWSYAERGRSRALADALAAAAPATAAAYRGQPGETPHVRALRRQLDAGYRRALSRRRGALSEDALAQEIATSEEALAAALGPSAPLTELQAPSIATSPAELAVLRGRLAPEQRLVEYQRLGDELWVFVVQPAGVEAVCLTRDADRIDRLVGELEYQLAKFNLGRGYAEAHAGVMQRTTDRVLDQLGGLLLGPLADALDGREVVVVPHGSLHNLPFAALRIGGRYAAEVMTISTAPSAATYGLLARRPTRGTRPPLVLGIGDDSTPAVAREARAVAGLFPRTRLLLGKAATRAAFAREVGGRRIVHVATHGLFRPKHPTLSALLMSDGWMTMHDLIALPIAADLVTVAACHSGQNHVGVGDELLGLTRGLLHAGARSVLVGQWAVDDDSAARLMTSFYQRHRAGESNAKALRAAMLAERTHRGHPYYWAPFNLVGAT